jgi:predicted nucleic acid-binding protein
MIVALDSNFLVYFFEIGHSPDDDPKIVEAQRLMGLLGRSATVMIPVQVYGELFSVAVRQKRPREEAKAMIESLRSKFGSIPSSNETLASALDLSTTHKLQFWDALIMSAAAEAGCELLLSEDMQSGFKWRGTTVVNPFAQKMDRRLKRVLEG